MAAEVTAITFESGDVVLLDSADFGKVVRFKWQIVQAPSGVKYAKCGRRRMHREILGCKIGDGILIDHENGDGLDNRRLNLRVASKMQNHRNTPKQRGSTSRFKGVSFHRGAQKWRAEIKASARIYLGTFAAEEDAARAYDDAARKYFGEFARVNFPNANEVGCLV